MPPLGDTSSLGSATITSWMSRLFPIFVLAACRLARACLDGDPKPVAQPASIDRQAPKTIAPPSTLRLLGVLPPCPLLGVVGVPANSLLLTTVSLRLPD